MYTFKVSLKPQNSVIAPSRFYIVLELNLDPTNSESELKWEENKSTGQEVTEWFTETV